MPFSVTSNFKVTSADPLDYRYGPYATTDQATGSLDFRQRFVGLTVLITGSAPSKEYWFFPTTASADLVEKSTAAGFPSTEASNLSSADKFFINTDPSNLVSGNKHITYTNLLSDLAGTNLAVSNDSDSLQLTSSVIGLTSLQSSTLSGSLLILRSNNDTDVHRITGSVSISGSSFTVSNRTAEFQVLESGIKLGNSGSDFHQVTGSIVMDFGDRLVIKSSQTLENNDPTGSLILGDIFGGTSTGYIRFRNSGRSDSADTSKIEFVNRGSMGNPLGEFIELQNLGVSGLYNTLIEQNINRTNIVQGRYQNQFSIGRSDSTNILTLQYLNETAGSPFIMQIGYEQSKREELFITSSNYLLTVTGSDAQLSGSLNVQNVLKIEGSNVRITGSLSLSGSSFSVIGGTDFQVQSTGVKLGNATSDSHQITGSLSTSGSVFMNLTSSATTVNQVVMRSATTGQLFVTASSAVGGGGSGAVSSVSGTGAGISVSPTTGNVIITNTGVTSIGTQTDSILTTNVNVGDVTISPVYQEYSAVFSQAEAVNSGEPVVTQLINTTGLAISWEKTSTGVYRISTQDDLFTANTHVQLSAGGYSDTPIAYWYNIEGIRDIFVFSYNIGTSSFENDLFEKASITIKVFP